MYVHKQLLCVPSVLGNTGDMNDMLRQILHDDMINTFYIVTYKIISFRIMKKMEAISAVYCITIVTVAISLNDFFYTCLYVAIHYVVMSLHF